MATVQNQMNGFDPSLEDLPAWKKDLILRRRANARIHGGGGMPPRSGGRSAPHSPTTSSSQPILPRLLQGSSQLSLRTIQGTQESLRSLCGPSNNLNQFNSASVGGSKDPSPAADSFSCCVSKGCDSAVNDGFPCVTSVSTDMRGPSTMHHKGGMPPESISSGGWHLNEEELEYGPGIVSRLKNRYMSLALREAKGRASLRKYSSLEDLLDDGVGVLQERGRSSQKERPAAGGSSAYKRDFMKRTRSMDSLSFRRTDSSDRVPKSHSSGALRHALEKEDVIIIEAPRRPAENGAPVRDPTVKKAPALPLEEEELPAPDTVKQVKQIFESSTKAPRGTAAKVAAYKAKKTVSPLPNLKPALKAKPLQLQNKKTLSPTIENARSSLKQVQPGVRSSPRSTMGIKAPSTPTATGLHSPLHPLPMGLTPITASVTAPFVNGNEAKKLLQDPLPPQSPEAPPALAPPRPHSPPTVLPPSPTPTHKVSIPSAFKGEPPTKESQRVLQENKKNAEKSIRALGDAPLKAPPEQVAKPAPLQEDAIVPQKTTRSLQESSPALARPLSPPPSVPPPRAFEGGSVSSPSVLEVIRAAEAKAPPAAETPTPSPSSGGLKPSSSSSRGGRDGRWHQQDNATLVFNFSKRTETPDYIENDGVDLSKRQFAHKHDPGYVIMPGYDGKNDSSTDGDDDGVDDATDASRGMGVPPPPCNISFEGEGVIIKGRSNLQRQPRAKKLEVSFDMPSTTTFEYPSENFLLQEMEVSERLSSPLAAGPPSGISASTGGLASYTPSKLQLSEAFELGVSRSAGPPHPPTPPRGRGAPLEAELLLLQDHVRPADESQTVTWSKESAPDMLF